MESPSPAGGGERYREHNVIRLESILVQLGGILNSGLFSMHAQSVVVVDNDDDDDDGDGHGNDDDDDGKEGGARYTDGCCPTMDFRLQPTADRLMLGPRRNDPLDFIFNV